MLHPTPREHHMQRFKSVTHVQRLALLHESELAHTDPDPQFPSPTDAVRHWPAKHSHLTQDVAREVDLSPPGLTHGRMQRSSAPSASTATRL